MTLNKNVFQVFISSGGEALPPALAECVRTVRQFSGEMEHKLLNGDEARAFVAAEFPGRVLDAYDRLVPFAFKKDLAEYCLLHKFGGWFADIAVTVRGNLTLPPHFQHVLFRDAPRPNQQPWETSNGLVYASAGSPIMQAAIDFVVANCEAREYGRCAHDPTGPGVLGRAAAVHGPDAATLRGMYMPLTPNHRIKNYAYLLPDGKILAFGKSNAGTGDGIDGLSGLGATGTDSYNKLYAARQIYAD